MPLDLTGPRPIRGLRDGTRVLLDGAEPLAVSDQGGGWLDLAAPDAPDPDGALPLALAAFEALSDRGGEVAIRLTDPNWQPLLPRLRQTGAALEIDGVPTVLPAAFWQVPDRWLMHDAPAWPMLWRPGPHGRHPLRPPKPRGLLYRRHIPWLARWFTLRAATLGDLPTFHRWQNDPRVAEFFDEEGTPDAHRAYLERLIADPHMLPVIGSLDGRDFACFELYWARENRLGAQYDAGAWDRAGMCWWARKTCAAPITSRPGCPR